jgi:hypothetical protein
MSQYRTNHILNLSAYLELIRAALSDDYRPVKNAVRSRHAGSKLLFLRLQHLCNVTPGPLFLRPAAGDCTRNQFFAT